MAAGRLLIDFDRDYNTKENNTMAIKNTCDVCGKSGLVPEGGEMIQGTQLRRTMSDEAEQLGLAANYAETKAEREEAEQRLSEIDRWEHYCFEHAEEIGIV